MSYLELTGLAKDCLNYDEEGMTWLNMNRDEDSDTVRAALLCINLQGSTEVPYTCTCTCTIRLSNALSFYSLMLWSFLLHFFTLLKICQLVLRLDNHLWYEMILIINEYIATNCI